MPQVIELCRGTGCDIAPYCYAYRLPFREKGIAIKERIPHNPGEQCREFKPKLKQRWTWNDDND